MISLHWSQQLSLSCWSHCSLFATTSYLSTSSTTTGLDQVLCIISQQPSLLLSYLFSAVATIITPSGIILSPWSVVAQQLNNVSCAAGCFLLQVLKALCLSLFSRVQILHIFLSTSSCLSSGNRPSSQVFYSIHSRKIIASAKNVGQNWLGMVSFDCFSHGW